MDVTKQLVDSILHSITSNPKFREILQEALDANLRDVIEPETTAIPNGNWLSIDTAPQDGSTFVGLLWDKRWNKWKADANVRWYKGLAKPKFIYDGHGRDDLELKYWAKPVERRR